MRSKTLRQKSTFALHLISSCEMVCSKSIALFFLKTSGIQFNILLSNELTFLHVLSVACVFKIASVSQTDNSFVSRLKFRHQNSSCQYLQHTMTSYFSRTCLRYVTDRNFLISWTLLKEIYAEHSKSVTHFTLGQLCYLTLSHVVCNVTPVVPKQELEQPASPLQIFYMRQAASSFQQTKPDLGLFGPFRKNRDEERKEGEVIDSRVHVCSWMSSALVS